MVSYILQGLILGFAAAVQPGPLQAYLVLQSLKNGWRRTIVFALVPLMSDLPIIGLVVFVLTVVPSAWVVALQLIGGVFLLYLAFGALRTAWNISDQSGAAIGSHNTSLFQAVLINLVNPNPYLFWSTVAGPILLTGWKESPAYGIGMLAAFYLTMILINAGIIVIVSFARQVNPRLRQILMILSAIGLAGFGVYQLWMGIMGLG
jgi:threonine/homoserine/homoserine lactone efflux protein